MSKSPKYRFITRLCQFFHTPDGGTEFIEVHSSSSTEFDPDKLLSPGTRQAMDKQVTDLITRVASNEPVKVDGRNASLKHTVMDLHKFMQTHTELDYDVLQSETDDELRLLIKVKKK